MNTGCMETVYIIECGHIVGPQILAMNEQYHGGSPLMNKSPASHSLELSLLGLYSSKAQKPSVLLLGFSSQLVVYIIPQNATG
jgi:hypothetical protein